MKGLKYLKILVEDIHSTTVATIGLDGHPQTRIIDMMHYDEQGVYFLTARGKSFFAQLIDQKFVAVSATKGKIAVSLRGNVKHIGKEKLDILMEKNPYMKEIYPGDTKEALEVFVINEAHGEYFDISNPSKVIRRAIAIGETKEVESGYYITEKCTGCQACLTVCPQNCISASEKPAIIDQDRCLHCGRCLDTCPSKAIIKRGE